MRFYTKQHKFYCGIDLHAKKMYLCILDAAGEVRLHRNIKTGREVFLKLIQPFREDVVVAVECMLGSPLLLEVSSLQHFASCWIGIVSHSLNFVNHPLENIRMVLRGLKKSDILVPMSSSIFPSSVLLPNI